MTETKTDDTEFLAWLDEAEKIASAAPQDNWIIRKHIDDYNFSDFICGVNSSRHTDAIANYIERFDPPTARKMIAELRRMLARIRELEKRWIGAQMMAIEDMARGKEGESE